MTQPEAAAILNEWVRRVRRLQAAREGLYVAAAALPAIWAGILFEDARVLCGIAGAMVMGAGAWLVRHRLRRAGIHVATMAERVNRIVPGIEESAHLLLEPPGGLSMLHRLQQHRALEAFEQVAAGSVLPASRLGLPAGVCVAVLGGCALLGARAGSQPEPGTVSPVPLTAAGSHAPDGPVPSLTKARVIVQPPAYTGLPRREVGGLTFEAVEGSRASWNLTVEGSAAEARLVYQSGDTLQLQHGEEGVFAASRRISESALYVVELIGASGILVRSGLQAVSVRHDEPPLVVVTAPEPRTLLKSGDSRVLAVRARADDDYGLTGARLVATVSSGSGENVKFRERTLPFDRTGRTDAATWSLDVSIPLDSLGMRVGDELYAYVEAIDNRGPEAQRGRSETFFVLLEDTSAQAEASGFGLVLDPNEAFLRSQRQIILDTEALIEERARIDRPSFEQRSNALGVDQKLLRLRYGQFLGEEFETGVTADERVSFDEAVSGHDGHDHAAEEEHAPGGRAAAAEDVRARYTHSHDSEEAATFFADDIRRRLKEALAEMWDAERYLRTLQPEEALPFEYEALRILKALQQQARIYVQRVGFDPPPLEPDTRRLTGDLEDVSNRRRVRSEDPAHPYPGLRGALLLLQRLDEGEVVFDVRELGPLEAAGRELGTRAVEEPGRYLDALTQLRELIDALTAGQPPCPGCITAVRSAIWTVLPPAMPVPSPGIDPESSLGARYHRYLGQ